MPQSTSQRAQKAQNRLFIFPYLFALITGLAACGGGDDGEPGPIPPTNQEIDTSTESIVNVTGDTTNAFDLGTFASTEAERAFDFQDAVVGLATTTNVHYCSSPDPLNVDTGNGNVTFIHVDEDPPGRSTNDSHTTNYNNCQSNTRVLNGSSSFTIVELVGVPFEPATAWTLTTTGTTDLTITFPTNERIVKSNYNFSSSTADGVQFTRSVNGTSEKTRTINSELRTSSSVFNLLRDWNMSTNAYTKEIDISRTGSFGTRARKTLTPLAGVGGPPETGILQLTDTAVTGEISITTYTALGGGNVLVEVDSNGDGVIDTTTETTWSALWQLNFI